MKTTIGQLLVNEALPEQYRDYERALTGEELEKLLTVVGRENPDLYKQVSFNLMDVGRKASYTEGVTLSIGDLGVPDPIARKAVFDFVDKQETVIRKAKDLTPTQKNEALATVYAAAQKKLTDTTMEAANAKGNPLALQVASKARGNPQQLTAMLSSPATYSDAKGNTIPIFVRRSYSEGLSPAEYYAATFGTRKGVVSTKFATRDAGDFGKQLAVAAADVIVTEEDCGTTNGIPVDVTDTDSVGALLAKDVGGYGAGAAVDSKMLNKMESNKFKKIVVRSPVTCQAKGGVCAKCVGLREDGKIPYLRQAVGIQASSALAERIAQGSLNVKHCLSAECEVRMADWSVKQIKDIKPGELVMGADKAGKLTPVKVLEVFENGEREVYRTTFRKGNVGKQLTYFDSTLDHKMLGVRMVYGQKEEVLNNTLRMLPVGLKSRTLHATGATGFDDTGLQDEPFALLVGLLLGDGCYTEAVSGIHLSTADDQLKEDIKDYLASLNLKCTKLVHHDYYHQISMIDDPLPRRADGTVIPGSRNPAKLFLEKHGMYGKRAENKVIPDSFYSWSNKSIAELLAGLIVTDGSVYRSTTGKGTSLGIAFCSSSRRLVEQVKELFSWRFGIHSSSITVTGKAGTRNHNFDLCQLTINGKDSIRRFSGCIPLVGVKRTRLKEYLEDLDEPTRNDDHYRMKRVKQEFLGNLPTYDLHVDHPDHLFLLACGVIVSNSGGQTSSNEKVYSGFDIINQIGQIPKVFKHKATLADVDGTVESVEEAPQGGTNITINGQVHYVDPEQEVTIKQGDTLEAGDALSTGIVNPAEVVKYKGIGEGRRYYAERLTKAFKDSKLKANRRNAEIVARATINHVEVNEPDGLGDYLPGDVVSYHNLAYSYVPRKDAKVGKPSKLVGKYLEQPYMQYSIGTRVTNKMAKELEDFGIDDIQAHDNEPGFQANMIRLRAVPHYGKDWIAKLQGSYLETNLLQDAQTAATSNIHGIHPVPAITYGKELGQSKKDEVTF